MSKPSSVVVGGDGTVKLHGPRATRVFYVGVGNVSTAAGLKIIQRYKDKLMSEGLDVVFYENFFVPLYETFQIKIEVTPWSK